MRIVQRALQCMIAISVGCLIGTRTGLATGDRFAKTPPPNSYLVRFAYIIPSDRKPQAEYRAKVATLIARIQTFYADQMEASGLGRRTFSVESAKDGRPEVHLIHSEMTAAVFADKGDERYASSKYWEHGWQAVDKAGFSSTNPGEIWMCFVEAQEQMPDGSIKNDICEGAGEFQAGIAVCSGFELSVAGDPDLIHDHRRYGGLVVPAIGPKPLKSHISFPDYEGDDVSSLAADTVGSIAHELGHCFQLSHCFLNDDNQCGNLMGNGLRGWRGYYMPQRFPDEDTRFDRPTALALKVCPFFGGSKRAAQSRTAPKVAIITPPGDLKLENGALHFAFTATEPNGPGIVLATLENGQDRDGVGVVAWQEFDGKSKRITSTIVTTAIDPGQDDTWRISVFDAAGNMTYQDVKLHAPNDGIGPRPFISVKHSRVAAGSNVSFTAIVDVENSTKYLWSFGDGATASVASAQHVFSKPGLYEVKLTEIDSAGRSGEVSQFLWVRQGELIDK